jgi:uncharacterized protein (DUF4415 family)
MSDTKKVTVKLRLDRDVLDWLLQQGDDCQTLINELLREHMEVRKKQQHRLMEISEIKRLIATKGLN